MTELRRSRTNKVFSGVCGGLGEYFDIDPIIFRIVFVLAAFAYGFSVVLYIILIIAIPRGDFNIDENASPKGRTKRKSGPRKRFDPADLEPEARAEFYERRKNKHVWLGGLLIAIGVVWGVSYFIPDIRFRDLWPLALIAAGLLILFKSTSSASIDNKE